MTVQQPASPESAPSYPLVRLGRLGKAHGFTVESAQDWITASEASWRTKVVSSTLSYWAKEGLITFRRDSPNTKRWYLDREMRILLSLAERGNPPRARAIYAHLHLREHDAQQAEEPREAST